MAPIMPDMAQASRITSSTHRRLTDHAQGLYNTDRDKLSEEYNQKLRDIDAAYQRRLAQLESADRHVDMIKQREHSNINHRYERDVERVDVEQKLDKLIAEAQHKITQTATQAQKGAAERQIIEQTFNTATAQRDTAKEYIRANIAAMDALLKDNSKASDADKAQAKVIIEKLREMEKTMDSQLSGANEKSKQQFQDLNKKLGDTEKAQITIEQQILQQNEAYKKSSLEIQKKLDAIQAQRDQLVARRTMIEQKTAEGRQLGTDETEEILNELRAQEQQLRTEYSQLAEQLKQTNTDMNSTFIKEHEFIINSHKQATEQFKQVGSAAENSYKQTTNATITSLGHVKTQIEKKYSEMEKQDTEYLEKQDNLLKRMEAASGEERAKLATELGNLQKAYAENRETHAKELEAMQREYDTTKQNLLRTLNEQIAAQAGLIAPEIMGKLETVSEELTEKYKEAEAAKTTAESKAKATFEALVGTVNGFKENLEAKVTTDFTDLIDKKIQRLEEERRKLQEEQEKMDKTKDENVGDLKTKLNEVHQSKENLTSELAELAKKSQELATFLDPKSVNSLEKKLLEIQAAMQTNLSKETLETLKPQLTEASGLIETLKSNTNRYTTIVNDLEVKISTTQRTISEQAAAYLQTVTAIDATAKAAMETVQKHKDQQERTIHELIEQKAKELAEARYAAEDKSKEERDALLQEKLDVLSNLKTQYEKAVEDLGKITSQSVAEKLFDMSDLQEYLETVKEFKKQTEELNAKAVLDRDDALKETEAKAKASKDDVAKKILDVIAQQLPGILEATVKDGITSKLVSDEFRKYFDAAIKDPTKTDQISEKVAEFLKGIIEKQDIATTIATKMSENLDSSKILAAVAEKVDDETVTEAYKKKFDDTFADTLKDVLQKTFSPDKTMPEIKEFFTNLLTNETYTSNFEQIVNKLGDVFQHYTIHHLHVDDILSKALKPHIQTIAGNIGANLGAKVLEQGFTENLANSVAGKIIGTTKEGGKPFDDKLIDSIAAKSFDPVFKAVNTGKLAEPIADMLEKKIHTDVFANAVVDKTKLSEITPESIVDKLISKLVESDGHEKSEEKENPEKLLDAVSEKIAAKLQTLMTKHSPVTPQTSSSVVPSTSSSPNCEDLQRQHNLLQQTVTDFGKKLRQIAGENDKIETTDVFEKLEDKLKSIQELKQTKEKLELSVETSLQKLKEIADVLKIEKPEMTPTFLDAVFQKIKELGENDKQLKQQFEAIQQNTGSHEQELLQCKTKLESNEKELALCNRKLDINGQTFQKLKDLFADANQKGPKVLQGKLPGHSVLEDLKTYMDIANELLHSVEDNRKQYHNMQQKYEQCKQDYEFYASTLIELLPNYSNSGEPIHEEKKQLQQLSSDFEKAQDFVKEFSVLKQNMLLEPHLILDKEDEKTFDEIDSELASQNKNFITHETFRELLTKLHKYNTNIKELREIYEPAQQKGLIQKVFGFSSKTPRKFVKEFSKDEILEIKQGIAYSKADGNVRTVLDELLVYDESTNTVKLKDTVQDTDFVERLEKIIGKTAQHDTNEDDDKKLLESVKGFLNPTGNSRVKSYAKLWEGQLERIKIIKNEFLQSVKVNDAINYFTQQDLTEIKTLQVLGKSLDMIIPSKIDPLELFRLSHQEMQNIITRHVPARNILDQKKIAIICKMISVLKPMKSQSSSNYDPVHTTRLQQIMADTLLGLQPDQSISPEKLRKEYYDTSKYSISQYHDEDSVKAVMEWFTNPNTNAKTRPIFLQDIKKDLFTAVTSVLSLNPTKTNILGGTSNLWGN